MPVLQIRMKDEDHAALGDLAAQVHLTLSEFGRTVLCDLLTLGEGCITQDPVLGSNEDKSIENHGGKAAQPPAYYSPYINTEPGKLPEGYRYVRKADGSFLTDTLAIKIGAVDSNGNKG